MSRFGYRNQREGQRGALLVLFALLLPVFLPVRDSLSIWGICTPINRISRMQLMPQRWQALPDILPAGIR